MIRFKESVKLNPTAPAIKTMLAALYTQSELDNREYTVTSANDSTHTSGSRHYTDEAIDIRVHDVYEPHKLARRLQEQLGERFTVLLEHEGQPNAHIHCQVRKGATLP